MPAFQAVGLFLASTFFIIIIYSLWLRIALAFFRISVLHPASQLIYKITDPFLSPLNALFNQTGKPKTRSRYDWTAFFALVIIEFIKITLLSLLIFGKLLPLVFLPLYVAAELILQPCHLLFYLILIQVILSWVNPGLQHALLEMIQRITAPALRLGRWIIPDISGFDFSPLIILLLLQMISLLIRYSLPWPLL